MKVLVVLLAALAFTAAVPQRRLSLNPDAGDQQPAEQNYNNYQQPELNIKDFRPRAQIETTTYIPILHFDKEQANDGSYKTSYETGNNIQAQEEGYLKTVGEGEDSVPALVQQGSYSYTAPDGQVISIEYTADEFGFKVSGDHIPTPPPVSPEIQKGLDLIYAGIRANAERNALELANNPGAAKSQEDKAALDYKGFYHQK